MGLTRQAKALLEETTGYARQHGILVGVAEGGAHLAEILARDCGLEVDDLPLTIGQAREFFQDNWQRPEAAGRSGAQLSSPAADTPLPTA